MVRFASVGIGGFAQAYLEALAEIERTGAGRHVAQVAIGEDQRNFADPIAELRARGVAIYDSFDDMLRCARRDIDVVCIPVGIPLHAPMAIASMEAGLHVLVEKPPAGCIQDVDAMIAASRTMGRFCAVGFQHMSLPSVKRLQQWVCEGRLGNVKRLRAIGGWPRDPKYFRRNRWAGRLKVNDTWVLDSPHQNAFAHLLNLMFHLGSGQPDQALQPISVRAELYRANDIESADSAFLRIETASGIDVFLAVSHCTDRDVEAKVILEAERGNVELSVYGGTTVHWADGTNERFDSDLSFRYEFEDIAAVARGDKPEPNCPVHLTRPHNLCVSGSFESSKIHSIPRDHLTAAADGTLIVRDMSNVLEQSFQTCQLPSDLHAPWSHPGHAVSLINYNHFPTRPL